MWIGPPYNLCVNRGEKGQSLYVFRSDVSRHDPTNDVTHVQVATDWVDQCVSKLNIEEAIKSGLEPYMPRTLTYDEKKFKLQAYQLAEVEKFLSSSLEEQCDIMLRRVEFVFEHHAARTTSGETIHGFDPEHSKEQLRDAILLQLCR